MQEEGHPGKPVGMRVALVLLWTLDAAVVIFLSVFITPKFHLIFDQLGMQDLPLPTQAMLALSSFCVDYWFILVPLWIGGAAAIATGGIDRARGRALLGLIAFFILFTSASTLCVFLPIIKIQQHLEHP